MNEMKVKKNRFKHAWLGMGGNEGDVIAALMHAISRLKEHEDIDVIHVSSFYETPPWGVVEQQNFINLCCEVATVLDPESLLSYCLSIEAEQGRVRSQKWGPRTLDIDLLIFEGIDAYQSKSLVLPHPHIQERAFVLQPLSEISPELTVQGRTIFEWNKQVFDSRIVILPTQFDKDLS